MSRLERILLRSTTFKRWSSSFNENSIKFWGVLFKLKKKRLNSKKNLFLGKNFYFFEEEN